MFLSPFFSDDAIFSWYKSISAEAAFHTERYFHKIVSRQPPYARLRHMMRRHTLFTPRYMLRYYYYVMLSLLWAPLLILLLYDIMKELRDMIYDAAIDIMLLMRGMRCFRYIYALCFLAASFSPSSYFRFRGSHYFRWQRYIFTPRRHFLFSFIFSKIWYAAMPMMKIWRESIYILAKRYIADRWGHLLFFTILPLPLPAIYNAASEYCRSDAHGAI